MNVFVQKKSYEKHQQHHSKSDQEVPECFPGTSIAIDSENMYLTPQVNKDIRWVFTDADVPNLVSSLSDIDVSALYIDEN